MTIRFVLGLALGFGIGFACRWFGIPVPAPPVLVGALLVAAMCCGYQLTDRHVTRRHARLASLCGGPDGGTRARGAQ